MEYKKKIALRTNLFSRFLKWRIHWWQYIREKSNVRDRLKGVVTGRGRLGVRYNVGKVYKL